MLSLIAALTIQASIPGYAFEGLPQCSRYSPPVRQGEAVIPSVGEERTAEVGEPVLISAGYDVQAAKSTFARDIIVSGRTSRAPFTLVVRAGSEAFSEAAGIGTTQFEYDGRGTRPTAVHFERKDGTLVARISWGFVKERHPVTSGDVELVQTECASIRHNTLIRHVAFTGVSRGVVSLEYREFAGNYARPAFTQTATYDLADGTVIGFRGARIEVLSADNTGIRYRIIRGFD